MIEHLDLFSGIGGFTIAAQGVWGRDYKNVGFCDNDEFCQKILKKHWPKAKIYGDIKTLKAEQIKSASLITGGFPCQPFSVAGEKKGRNDDRYLWPEMFRLIRELHPSWVIGENVAGIVNMELEQVCLDLESEGYEVQPFIIPAASIGAPHRRNRVWILANSDGAGSQGSKQAPARNRKSSESFEDSNWLETATRLCGVDDGIPGRIHRIKALGNAIVPQVAVEIMEAIKILDRVNSPVIG